MTNNDLKQIKTLLTPLETDLNGIRKDFGGFRNELDGIRKDFGGFRNELDGIRKDIKDVKKRVRKTEKTVDLMIDIFDKQIVGTQKRVGKIEEHLNLQ